jgi:hypothetical protein
MAGTIVKLLLGPSLSKLSIDGRAIRTIGVFTRHLTGRRETFLRYLPAFASLTLVDEPSKIEIPPDPSSCIPDTFRFFASGTSAFT